jgi:hypothetical protein
MNAPVVTVELVNGPIGTAIVTQRYSIVGLLGKEDEIVLASVTSHEGSGGGEMMGEDRTRGWRVWKAGWSWRRERADVRSVVVGRGVSVARVWVDVKSGRGQCVLTLQYEQTLTRHANRITC